MDAYKEVININEPEETAGTDGLTRLLNHRKVME